MITALASGDDRVLVGTAAGEVLCANYFAPTATDVVDLFDCVEWKHHATLAAITCVAKAGSEVLVGDADGTVVLLDADTGVELRRYAMEGAVVAATWHHKVFVVSDHVGNVYGVDKFRLRWKKRMDMGGAPGHVQSMASVRLRDAENQLCAYVAMSLGGLELLLTHEGHVLCRLPTTTAITSIAMTDDGSRIFCGGSNGTLYELLSVGKGSALALQLCNLATVPFPITSLHMTETAVLLAGSTAPLLYAMALASSALTPMSTPQAPAFLARLPSEEKATAMLLVLDDQETFCKVVLPVGTECKVENVAV
ncbi:hypothetical protein SPRG_04758 [Saprolegnia parasitica CBS 223.65]|uniref:Anaphase-promoting complex subunit 4 WD40 domain-containing protein n=1 Tax=Saprolegnia parasitica (strain CBS 223.65) TaxID=695850 RepID=A0A067CWF4_SAPPC|nr:hypothetical protein SPRG_04758 [Saprolegnia parasitica CBS 223.65]KDO30856.1 hypothetical protein SPRG_04758 [Saprolegnia parasitica CBS 223.65]|eukprot:XP_012198551.1 hypothetical protein SPRG_04758 [Saprolegnia parasitica CBS 223.65]